MTELSLFYNHKAFKDVLILVADESEAPNKISFFDDVVILQKDDKLVGVNIFNSLEYVKIKASGLVHSVNYELAKLISNLIKDHSGFDVVVINNTFILGRVEEIRGEDIFIDIKESQAIRAKSLVPDLKVGDYVEVAYKETRLKTGHKAYHYLKNEADYLITDKDLTPGEPGMKLYTLQGEK